MWLLLLSVMHVNDPSDVPGEIRLTFNTEAECHAVANTVSFKLKFPDFKVVTKCKQS